MKIEGDWLNGAVQQVFGLLESGDHRVFAVGGCVRNSLMGVPVNDIDLATDALPEQVVTLGQAAGLKVVPTGIEHGTVTVVVDGQGFEVTTFRHDVETDGRRAVVAFSDNIETDAKRRDFTVNALYADRTGEIFDPLGGLADIPERRIRFIDDAEARIREDGLRILRFFRFYAAYGNPAAGLDADGLSACASNLAMLDDLSAERIGAEVRKLLGVSDPAPAVSSMETSGVLAQIMPGAVAGPLAPLVHTENGRQSRWIRRLAVIGGRAVSDRLRLSKQEMKALDAIAVILEDGLNPKLAAYRFEADRAVDAELIKRSMSGMIADDQIEQLADKGAALEMPVKAKMVMKHVSPGPELGALLKRLEDEWIASDFKLTKAELLEIAAR